MNKNIYVSTFISGFEYEVEKLLKYNLNDINIIEKQEGLIIYKTSFPIKNIISLPFLNNSFLLLYQSKNKGPSLNSFIKEIYKNTRLYKLGKIGRKRITYRIMGFIENKPVKLPIKFINTIRKYISRKQKNMKFDDTSPNTEIWISIRRNEKGLFMLRLTKKNATKGLHKGELRIELSYLISSLPKIKSNDIIIDPFAGYGGLVYAILKYFPLKQIIINDINTDKLKHCKKKISNNYNNYSFLNDDALYMSLKDNSVDHIITDPPRGLFEKLSPDIKTFYNRLFGEFSRILKNKGTITICTAQKEIIRNLSSKYYLDIKREISTLVSGKKVSVFHLKRKYK